MKKLKLSLSLCMMCLCVAVLCMGILAVSSATYNINGNISYNMVDGVALVNTRVYKVAGTNSSLSTSCTTLSTMTFETIEQTSGYVLSQKLDTKATLSSGAKSSEIPEGSLNIGFGATDSSVYYYTFYIVINITNLTDAGALSATLTDNTTYASTITKVVNTSQMTTIEKGDTKNIVIGLTIPSTTTDEIDTTISYSLIVNYKNYQCTLDGTTIYFTKDMTWTGYIESLDSSTTKFGTSGDYVTYDSKIIQLNSTSVKGTDEIVYNEKYTLKTDTGNSVQFKISDNLEVYYEGTCASGTSWSNLIASGALSTMEYTVFTTDIDPYGNERSVTYIAVYGRKGYKYYLYYNNNYVFISDYVCSGDYYFETKE